jgi:hypothetical protein
MTKKMNSQIDGLQDYSLDQTEKLERQEIENMPEVYKPVGMLHVPEETKEYFDMQGYDLRWVRIGASGTNGELDQKNIMRREAEGYIFIKREEVIGLGKSRKSHFEGEFETSGYGLYVIGGMALTKFPKHLAQSKRQHLDNITRSRSQAIIRDLKKDAVSPNSGSNGNSKEIIDFGETRQGTMSKERSTKFGK